MVVSPYKSASSANRVIMGRRARKHFGFWRTFIKAPQAPIMTESRNTVAITSGGVPVTCSCCMTVPISFRMEFSASPISRNAADQVAVNYRKSDLTPRQRAMLDFALKVAMFHTIFNVMGVAIMLPLLNRLIGFIETVIKEPQADLSRPKYLSEAVDEFPATIVAALRKEVKHLYDNSVELIAHGLNLSRQEIFATKDVAATVRSSRKVVDFDFDARYEARVKTLYAAIVEFTTRTGAKDLPPDVTDRIYILRDVAGQIAVSYTHLTLPTSDLV